MACTEEQVQLWDSEAAAAGTNRVPRTRPWPRESVTQLTQASQDSSFYKRRDPAMAFPVKPWQALVSKLINSL